LFLEKKKKYLMFYDYNLSNVEKIELSARSGPPYKGGGAESSKDKLLEWAKNVNRGVSKVVNENGEPLVVYHGTNKRFNVFSKSNDIGYHFGTKEAARRAKRSTKKEGEWFVGQYFLNIRNPLEVPDLGTWSLIHLVPVLRNKGIIPANVSWFDIKDEGTRRARKENRELAVWVEKGKEGMSDHEWNNLLSSWEEKVQEKTREVIVEYLKDAGYDGLKYVNSYEGGYSWIALDPTQIKSATDNSGNFDPENPDFTKSFVVKTCKIFTRSRIISGKVYIKQT